MIKNVKTDTRENNIPLENTLWIPVTRILIFFFYLIYPQQDWNLNVPTVPRNQSIGRALPVPNHHQVFKERGIPLGSDGGITPSVGVGRYVHEPTRLVFLRHKKEGWAGYSSDHRSSLFKKKRSFLIKKLDLF